jgi:hypothetical protein
MKKILLTTLTIALAATFSAALAAPKIETKDMKLDMKVSATSTATTTPLTSSQIFTACSQDAIEMRDDTISSARATYNSAMTAALSQRKDSEKQAVGAENDDEKKNILTKAADEYKDAVHAAQDNLSKARKDAWSQFEADVKACRDVRDGTISKNASKAEKTETKSEKEDDTSIIKSFFEAIKGIFRK